MQSALRQASCRAEVRRRFLEWITGETSPTLYVSFGKRKRENTCACIIRAARVLFCIDNVQFDLCTDPRRRKRRTLLAAFPKGNILAEPAKRDTAAAVALGAGWVAARDHAATMLVLPADHVITNRAAFQETLALAAATAEETGELVTIGIKPTWACPGFGYIEQGEPVHLRNRSDKDAIHRVLRFREKPNIDLAESFLRKGNFRWNAGMFVWSVPTVLSEFNRH